MSLRVLSRNGLGAIDQDTRLAADQAGLALKMDKQDLFCLELKEEMKSAVSIPRTDLTASFWSKSVA